MRGRTSYVGAVRCPRRQRRCFAGTGHRGLRAARKRAPTSTTSRPARRSHRTAAASTSNAYRHKWISIFLQAGGESSYIGEVWYAEADTPVGPWVYARKVVTHNKYSFYNPKQHPFFDQDGGRTIYFRGHLHEDLLRLRGDATPRYDYNQIMYRLSLDDPRLILPAPVYQVRDGQGGRDYLMGDAVTQADKWDSVESAAFYAFTPDRTDKQLIPIYVETQNPGVDDSF